MTECIYFSYEYTTHWYGVFDYPDYEYYCLVGEEKKKIFSLSCSGCPYYTKRRGENHDS